MSVIYIYSIIIVYFGETSFTQGSHARNWALWIPFLDLFRNNKIQKIPQILTKIPFTQQFEQQTHTHALHTTRTHGWSFCFFW